MGDYTYDETDPSDVNCNGMGLIAALVKAIDDYAVDNTSLVIQSTALGLLLLDKLRPTIAPGFLGLDVQVVSQFWDGLAYPYHYELAVKGSNIVLADIEPMSDLARSA